MIIAEKKDKLEISELIINQYNLCKTAFFDIETTGFDKINDRVILISLGKFIAKDVFYIKQYFAEDLFSESEIIKEFLNDLNDNEQWCSYNGLAFDEPFLKSRIKINGLCEKLPKKHLDLYRKIRPYYKQLGLSRCNLKTVEKYLRIERQDKIDGGMSVELYNEYLINRSTELRNIIMLHNYEDVMNLPRILGLVFEIEKNSSFIPESCISEKQKKYLIFLMKKNNMGISFDINRISKKAASRMIDYLLKGNNDIDELIAMIDNSY